MLMPKLQPQIPLRKFSFMWNQYGSWYYQTGVSINFISIFHIITEDDSFSFLVFPLLRPNSWTAKHNSWRSWRFRKNDDKEENRRKNKSNKLIFISWSVWWNKFSHILGHIIFYIFFFSGWNKKLIDISGIHYWSEFFFNRFALNRNFECSRAVSWNHVNLERDNFSYSFTRSLKILGKK